MSALYWDPMLQGIHDKTRDALKETTKEGVGLVGDVMGFAGNRWLQKRAILSAAEPIAKAGILAKGKAALTRVAGLFSGMEGAEATVANAKVVEEAATVAGKGGSLGKFAKVGGKVALVAGIAISAGEGVYAQQKLGQSPMQAEITRRREGGLSEWKDRIAAGFSAGWNCNLVEIQNRLASDREAFHSRVQTMGKTAATVRLIGDSVMTTLDIFSSPFNVAGRGVTDAYMGMREKRKWPTPSQLAEVRLERPNQTHSVREQSAELTRE